MTSAWGAPEPPARPLRTPAPVREPVAPGTWLRMLCSHFGSMPRDYMVIDIETSGPSIQTDLILELGHVIVEDGVPVERMSFMLNWADDALVDVGALRARMEWTRSNMANRGRVYQMHFDQMVQTGAAPVSALEDYLALILDVRKAGYKFVMHNGYGFDVPRLCEHFRRWVGAEFDFGPNEVWDTGMIEKSLASGQMAQVGDTIKSWSRRVSGSRKAGVNWSLAEHCVPKYGLAQKAGVDMSESHGAGHDTFVTHLLFEEFRRIAATPDQEDPSGQVVRGSDPGGATGRYDHLGS